MKKLDKLYFFNDREMFDGPEIAETNDRIFKFRPTFYIPQVLNFLLTNQINLKLYRSNKPLASGHADSLVRKHPSYNDLKFYYLSLPAITNAA